MQVTRSPVFSHFAESLAGMDTIRAYGYEDRFAMMSNDRVDYNHRCGRGSLQSGRGSLAQILLPRWCCMISHHGRIRENLGSSYEGAQWRKEAHGGAWSVATIRVHM